MTPSKTSNAVGKPSSWALDFGVIATIAAAVAYCPDLASTAVFLTAGQVRHDIIGTLGAHAGLGALMGALLCAMLGRAYGRRSLHSFWPVVLGAASLWGVSSLLIARTFYFSLSWDMGGHELQHFFALVLGGAGFGVVVYGPLWILYTFLSVFQARGRRLLVLLSVVTAAFAAPISRFLMQLIQG